MSHSRSKSSTKNIYQYIEIPTPEQVLDRLEMHKAEQIKKHNPMSKLIAIAKTWNMEYARPMTKELTEKDPTLPETPDLSPKGSANNSPVKKAGEHLNHLATNASRSPSLALENLEDTDDLSPRPKNSYI